MNIDVKLNIDMEVNQIKREALIREYERRIAVLKSGGSPSAVIFQWDCAAESESTDSGEVVKCRNGGDGTRTVSGEWTAKEDGREIAEISFQIKALPGFKNEDTGMILRHFADMSRLFYLKAGNALKETKPGTVSTEDVIRNCVTEMFRTFTANAKDCGCIVLTEDDLREDERPVMGQGMLVQTGNPLRVHIRAFREDRPIIMATEDAEVGTRLEAALRAVEEVKKVHHDAEICVEVDV